MTKIHLRWHTYAILQNIGFGDESAAGCPIFAKVV